jgi:hypothetical protein
LKAKAKLFDSAQNEWGDEYDLGWAEVPVGALITDFPQRKIILLASTCTNSVGKVRGFVIWQFINGAWSSEKVQTWGTDLLSAPRADSGQSQLTPPLTYIRISIFDGKQQLFDETYSLGTDILFLWPQLLKVEK